MRNNLVLPFRVEEEHAKYTIDRTVRDAAFRKIVLAEYNFLCTICHSKFLLRQDGKEPLVEADAAHIISIGTKAR